MLSSGLDLNCGVSTRFLGLLSPCLSFPSSQSSPYTLELPSNSGPLPWHVLYPNSYCDPVCHGHFVFLLNLVLPEWRKPSGDHCRAAVLCCLDHDQLFGQLHIQYTIHAGKYSRRSVLLTFPPIPPFAPTAFETVTHFGRSSAPK